MVLLIALIAIGVFMMTTQNYFCKNLFTNKSDNFAYSLILYVIAMLTTFFMNGAVIRSFSAFTCIDGIIYGLMMLFELICTLQAYKNGPMSLTTLFTVASVMIPIIPAWIFWGDPVTWQQVSGIIVMFIAAALILNVGSEFKKEKINIKWFLYALGAFICSGIAGINEKLITVSGNEAQSNEFILIGFAAGSAAMIIALLLSTKKEPVTIRFNTRIAVPTLVIGICTCLVSVITMAVLAVLPASVVFTVNNGARLILVTLIDVIFFKEKITGSQYAGLGLGIIGVALLSLS